jgi:hypothetical protein
MRPHQRGQRPGERSAPFVLERMDDRSQRALVTANRAAPVDEPCGSPAPRTARQRQADRPPGRQRIPTAIAKRRRERQDRSPAAWADRSARRLVERLFACSAGRRQHNRQDGVESRSHSRATTSIFGWFDLSRSRPAWRYPHVRTARAPLIQPEPFARLPQCLAADPEDARRLGWWRAQRRLWSVSASITRRCAMKRPEDVFIAPPEPRSVPRFPTGARVRRRGACRD